MAKELKINLQKEVKENFYLTIYNLIKQGKNPSKISNELNIPIQNVEYYLKKLREKGMIKKLGYGTWEVKNDLKHPYSSKQIRGHAFIWKIKLKKPEKWKNITIEHKLVGKEKFPRIMINNRKIWLGKKSIIVYEPHSYYANTPLNSRKYAVINLIEILKKLEKELKINLKPYTFKPSREHYGLVKNDLAIQCNRNKEKIHIKDDIEGEWLWIDDSESLGELETGGLKALTRGTQVQNWWNNHKATNFKVTPEFILNTMNGIQQNQLIFDKNMSSHLRILQKMERAIDRLGKIIEKKNIKEDLGKQTSLDNFK